MKRCTTCKELRELSEFHKDKRHKDGLEASCKLCAAEYQRRHYQAHKEQKKAYSLAHREERRESAKIRSQQYAKRTKEDILGHYGGGAPICITCGESRLDCLSIDHINGNGSKHRKELGLVGQGFYRWLKQEAYPEGYQTLCMNCQFVKRVKNKESPNGIRNKTP